MKSQTSPAAYPPALIPVCRTLDDRKAGEIRIFCVQAQSSITDYLVIATATSEPHLRALRVELEKAIDATDAHIVGMDTTHGSGWLVVDAFDVMVHVFTAETRNRYALENLWKDADEIRLGDVIATPKPIRKVVAAPAPRRAAAKPEVKAKPKAKAKVKAAPKAKAAPKPKAKVVALKKPAAKTPRAKKS